MGISRQTQQLAPAVLPLSVVDELKDKDSDLSKATANLQLEFVLLKKLETRRDLDLLYVQLKEREEENKQAEQLALEDKIEQLEKLLQYYETEEAIIRRNQQLNQELAQKDIPNFDLIANLAIDIVQLQAAQFQINSAQQVKANALVSRSNAIQQVINTINNPTPTVNIPPFGDNSMKLTYKGGRKIDEEDLKQENQLRTRKLEDMSNKINSMFTQQPSMSHQRGIANILDSINVVHLLRNQITKSNEYGDILKLCTKVDSDTQQETTNFNVVLAQNASALLKPLQSANTSFYLAYEQEKIAQKQAAQLEDNIKQMLEAMERLRQKNQSGRSK